MLAAIGRYSPIILRMKNDFPGSDATNAESGHVLHLLFRGDFAPWNSSNFLELASKNISISSVGYLILHF